MPPEYVPEDEPDDSRTAIVFVSEGSERVKTATLSFKPNQPGAVKHRNQPQRYPIPGIRRNGIQVDV